MTPNDLPAGATDYRPADPAAYAELARRLEAIRARTAARIADNGPCPAPDPSDYNRGCTRGAGHDAGHANQGNAWTGAAYPYAYRAAEANANYTGGNGRPWRLLQVATVAAAAELAADDLAAGVHRDPRALVLDAAELAGHPRTTTHPDTYGHCELDDCRSVILAAYRAARYPDAQPED